MNAVLAPSEAYSTWTWFLTICNNQVLKQNPLRYHQFHWQSHINLDMHDAPNIGVRSSKCFAASSKVSFSPRFLLFRVRFVSIWKKKKNRTRDTNEYMRRPLQTNWQYFVEFINTFWRPLLRTVRVQFHSVAVTQKPSSRTFHSWRHL